MDEPRTALARLLQFFDTYSIGYAFRGDILQVHASPQIVDDDIVALPAHMTVMGSLSLAGSRVTALPEHLTVLDDLDISATSISKIPESLRVGGSFDMRHTEVCELPANLHITKCLDLAHSPIQHLPAGLRIGGSLNLEGTWVRRFPEDMMVGGWILPPATLLDLQAFMAHEPHEVSLSLFGSQHERMDLRTRLPAYPDLWRVVQSLPEGVPLVLGRDMLGHVQVLTQVEPNESWY